jgi:ketosteroid isomerase-like protein
MTKKTGVIPALFAICCAWSGAVNAQDSEEDRANVWSVIEQQWDAVENDDKKWTDRFLAEDFSGWPNSSPAPRNRASTKMWDRFNDTQGEVVAHELYPMAIVIHGDVAVAHYLYTSAFENKDGEVEVNNGRYSDILVRTQDGWKFLSWHGGDDD